MSRHRATLTSCCPHEISCPLSTPYLNTPTCPFSCAVISTAPHPFSSFIPEGSTHPLNPHPSTLLTRPHSPFDIAVITLTFVPLCPHPPLLSSLYPTIPLPLSSTQLSLSTPPPCLTFVPTPLPLLPMTLPTWFPSASAFFPWNNIILISWISLWFFPTSPYTRYTVLIPVLLLSLSYTSIFFKSLAYPYNPTDTPITFFTNFFTLEGWQNIVKDPYSLIAFTNHFCLMDAWTGQWIVQDFYTQFTCGWALPPKRDGTGGRLGWTVDRVILTLILVVCYMVPPFGFLIYWLMRTVRYSQFPSDAAIVMAEKRK